MKRFVADGVHQTSVSDIVADVGVTERTFYRHFPSKHAVIFADYDIGFEWFARALALRPHGEPITVSVRKAVDAFPFDFAMVREAATIRSRDLDQDIITSHIRRMRDQVADELEGFSFDRAKSRASTIFETTREVFERAKVDGVPPAVAADRLAEQRIAEVSRLRGTWLPN